MAAGDWPCPTPTCVNHTKLVFGSKATCPKCGASRDDPQQALSVQPAVGDEQQPKPESGMQGGDMPGDWQCPNQSCINHTKMVFGKRSACPSCGTARNAKQPGDWQCPNPQCLNHSNTVFASKLACPKCGSPRPGSFAPVLQLPAVRAPAAAAAYAPANGGGGGGGHWGASAAGGQPGDWQCPDPSCMNNKKMVFGKNATCPKCGAPRESAACSQGGSNPGDWQCPNADCLNHRNKVFAKHNCCPSCGSEKPWDAGAAAARGRSRSPYGLAS